MSGIEASRLLRPKKQALDFIIMALSADVMPDQTKQALDAGVDEYLTKPLDRRVLMNHLQACCKEVLQPVD
jgi:CheY-like chemotaxis protein